MSSAAAFAREAAKDRVSTEVIKALHDEGLSCHEVGRRLGLRPSTIWARLKRAGVVRKKNVLERYDVETVARAVALYQSGLGLIYVRRFLKLRSSNAAMRVLRNAGVEIRAK